MLKDGTTLVCRMLTEASKWGRAASRQSRHASRFKTGVCASGGHSELNGPPPVLPENSCLCCFSVPVRPWCQDDIMAPDRVSAQLRVAVQHGPKLLVSRAGGQCTLRNRRWFATNLSGFSVFSCELSAWLR